MKREFNLSEKIEYVYNMKYGKQAIKLKDVIEFIRLLKKGSFKFNDKNYYKKVGIRNIDKFIIINEEDFDTLAGDDLK